VYTRQCLFKVPISGNHATVPSQWCALCRLVNIPMSLIKRIWETRTLKFASYQSLMHPEFFLILFKMYFLASFYIDSNTTWMSYKLRGNGSKRFVTNTRRLVIWSFGMSEWLLFIANSAIFQLYHYENKLIFNEITYMMKSTLYHRR